MAQKNDIYAIPLSNLKPGKHQYNYVISDSFFENIEYSFVKKGRLNVKIILDKQSTMLVFDFMIHGYIEVVCDRCTEDFNLPVKGDNRLIVKVNNDYLVEEETEVIISISSQETSIDLKPYIYEFTNLLVPLQMIHANEDDCEKTMLSLIEKHTEKETIPGTDPRWETLKNLL